MMLPSRSRVFGGLLALAVTVCVSGWLTAQNAKPSKKDEVEEQAPQKNRKVTFDPDVFGDDGSSQPKKKKTPAATEVKTSIEDALATTTNEALLALYRDVMKPHDTVTYRDLGGESQHVDILPLQHYFPGDKLPPNGTIDANSYDREWRPSRDPVKYKNVQHIRAYEDMVLDKVDKFLKQDAETLHLSRAEMFQAAETVLTAADKFHRDAYENGRRRGDEWLPVAQRLRDALREKRRERLKVSISAGKWDDALTYARTLAVAYREPGALAPFAADLVGMIDSGLSDPSSGEQLRNALNQFHQLEEIFPASEAPIVQGREKLSRLLRDRSQQTTDTSVLHVGVRDLPEHIAPGDFAGDTDLRARQLLYEGLVKLRQDETMGPRYIPVLAGETPRLIPLGREFRMARGAAWSDGHLVSISDVKQTLLAMRHKDWVGHSPLWSKLVEDAEPGLDAARSSMSLRLSQGYMDPLSLMTFPLVRDRSIGSGPYVLEVARDKPQKPNAKTTVTFVANPEYAGREGKFGLPRIRTIQFVKVGDPPDDAVQALRDGKIDLALDLTAQQAKDLRFVDKIAVHGPMKNRRVWFLALNHRQPEIKDNEFLGPALAYAINRQVILAKYFSGDEPKNKPYRSLNSPFPAGSWPCNTQDVPAELYDADKAKGQAAQAIEKAGGKPIKLTIIYPAGDDTARQALEYLCTSVNNLLRINDKTYIELTLAKNGLAPAELREAVEGSHDYHVAYYHYDHPSEAYWLAPLFDTDDHAREPNGSNYLGYENAELQQRLASVTNQRDFAEVQKGMRLVHRMLYEKMPLVPLWQLDTFLAHSKRLNFKDATIDPLLVFNEVEQWELEKR